jgi:hypothetical protein
MVIFKLRDQIYAKAKTSGLCLGVYLISNVVLDHITIITLVSESPTQEL